MLRTAITISLLILSDEATSQEMMVCSYPSYGGGHRQVIIDVAIRDKEAKIDDYRYQVLQNTPLGLVLVRAFAEYNVATKKNDLGLFGIVINKKDLSFTRGNILASDSENSIAKGTCKMR